MRDRNGPAASQAGVTRRIYLDQTHLRGHVTGIERVTLDLFAPDKHIKNPLTLKLSPKFKITSYTLIGEYINYTRKLNHSNEVHQSDKHKQKLKHGILT